MSTINEASECKSYLIELSTARQKKKRESEKAGVASLNRCLIKSLRGVTVIPNTFNFDDIKNTNIGIKDC